MGKGKRKRPEEDALTGKGHQIDPNSNRAKRLQARTGAEEGGPQEHTQAETSQQGEERATASTDEETTDSRASSSDSESDSSEAKKPKKNKKEKKDKKPKKDKKEKKAKKESQREQKPKETEGPQLTLEELKRVLLQNPEMAQSLFEDAQVKV